MISTTAKVFFLYVLVVLVGVILVSFCAQNVCNVAEPPELMSAPSGEQCSVGEIRLGPSVGIREFVSLQELQDWLERDELDSYVYKDTDFDCDDFAYELVRRAWNDGYYMETEVMRIENGNNHITNKTKIGNMLYKINPETDEVIELCPLD